MLLLLMLLLLLLVTVSTTTVSTTTAAAVTVAATTSCPAPFLISLLVTLFAHGSAAAAWIGHQPQPQGGRRPNRWRRRCLSFFTDAVSFLPSAALPSIASRLSFYFKIKVNKQKMEI